MSRVYASLPLTGPTAGAGRDVLRGAQLALEGSKRITEGGRGQTAAAEPVVVTFASTVLPMGRPATTGQDGSPPIAHARGPAARTPLPS